MPLYDITNPRTIIFLIENYEKESRLRLKWIEKNKKQILEAATFSTEPKNYSETDVLACKMESGLAALSRDHESGARHKIRRPQKDTDIIQGFKQVKRKNILLEAGLADPEGENLQREEERERKRDTCPEPIMRPVDPKVANIIYKSRPEFGREVYLKQRCKLMPEKRYYFSESFNSDYGWRLGDSLIRNNSLYGRRGHLTKAIQNRVGPQPDPRHYKPATISALHKCTDL